METFFIVVLMLIVAAGLILFGVVLARDALAADRTELDEQREVVRAEWTALNNTRRINDVFFQARDAMRRAEADKRGLRHSDPTVIDGEWS